MILDATASSPAVIWPSFPTSSRRFPISQAWVWFLLLVGLGSGFVLYGGIDHPWRGVGLELWLGPVCLWGMVWIVTRLSPRPQFWSRLVVVTISLTLLLRYLVWRTLITLNWDSWGNGILSLAFLGIEVLVLGGQALQLYLTLKIKPRTTQANALEPVVIDGDYSPSVDILIPTYDEPLAILRRTVVGCQALDYPNVQIYLLDDTDRPAVKTLAQQLGCHYLSRPEHHHAKAGNLNYGLGQSQGELVVVFDADFVPTQNFLTRTVGWFQDQTVGLVQTYQSFYNHDPISRNLGLSATLPQEVEIFSRHYQVLRDGIGSAICYGSGFVVRREALEAVGGFDCDSLSEDYLTGVRLRGVGWQVVYLPESLSAGLCAEDISGHLQQRLRWARGSLQSFFVAANPLTIPGLPWLERLAHLEGLVQWLHSLIRLLLLLLPLLVNGLGLLPLGTSVSTWLSFALPYYAISLTSFAWLNGRSRALLISDLYSLVQCVPLSLVVLQTLISPFSASFRVTPKGQHPQAWSVNGQLAWPILGLIGLTLFNAALACGQWQNPNPTVGHWAILGLAWSSYNLVLLLLALLAVVDAPAPDGFTWLAVCFPVTVRLNLDCHWMTLAGRTRLASEGGVQIVGLEPVALAQIPPNTAVEIQFPAANLTLAGLADPDRAGLNVAWSPMGLRQYRQLVALLFCRPGQWLWPQAPAEIKSVLALFQALVCPVWWRYPQGYLAPVAVSSGVDPMASSPAWVELPSRTRQLVG